MKVVLQKVTQASVVVNGEPVARIGEGILALVGVKVGDTSQDAAKLATKVLKAKLFEDKSQESLGKYAGRPWRRSLMEHDDLSIIAVPQFTLYGTLKKGGAPDFHKAEKPEAAKELFDHFVAQMQAEIGQRAQQGVFGAMMEVALVNDGPVTILYDTD